MPEVGKRKIQRDEQQIDNITIYINTLENKMPFGIEEPNRKLLTTEPIGKDEEGCEQRVGDAVRSAFATRDCIGYWRYPIFRKTGETRKESEFYL